MSCSTDTARVQPKSGRPNATRAAIAQDHKVKIGSVMRPESHRIIERYHMKYDKAAKRLDKYRTLLILRWVRRRALEAFAVHEPPRKAIRHRAPLEAMRTPQRALWSSSLLKLPRKPGESSAANQQTDSRRETPGRLEVSPKPPPFSPQPSPPE
jgi:hypothetical protein